MKNGSAGQFAHVFLPDEIAEGPHVETVLLLANELRAAVARVYDLPVAKVNIKISLSKASRKKIGSGDAENSNAV